MTSLTNKRANAAFATRRNAFTLVELLVVIAIIGLLVSLLIPAIQAARESARRSQCAGNMKQMSLAILNYHDTLKMFPSGNIVHKNLYEETTCHSVPPVEDQMIYCGSIGWPALILPFMEQDALYQRIDFDKLAYLPGKSDYSHHETHGDEANRFAATNMPDVFVCPSATRIAEPNTHKDYGINGFHSTPDRPLKSDRAIFHANSGKRMSDITRGTTNVFMLLEVAHAWWWAPEPGHVAVFPETGANPFFWLNSSSQGYVCAAGFDARNNEETRYAINKRTNWIPTRYPRSYHPKGINVALCDGGVSFVNENMDYENYKGLFEMTGPSLAKLP